VSDDGLLIKAGEDVRRWDLWGRSALYLTADLVHSILSRRLDLGAAGLEIQLRYACRPTP
jgi:hypothetical protein